jgi:hypothetical protein
MKPIIEEIPLEEFDLSLAEMRIINPDWILRIQDSLHLHGLLQPVVARFHEGKYQVIDGIKRVYAAIELAMNTLECYVLDVDLKQAKLLVLSYNRPHQSMEVWEEAMVLEDLLKRHELAAHDWSDYNITFTLSGKTEQVTFFSYILCCSRRQYISVVDDKKQQTLFRELIAAFIYMDGVPREIRGDNQKACVDRWELGSPVFNRKYLEFATWYRFTPKTITPRRPSENLKVERPFWYLEQNFLNGREFKDREDLKSKLQLWLRQVNDVRVHGTTKKRPIDSYIQEQAHLQPLPANHYDTSVVKHKVVNQESCIYWEGYLYVVPGKYMFELCPVRITGEQMIVYAPSGEQIACHPLAEKGRKGRYVGEHKKPCKKPRLVIADVISRLESFSPEMSGHIEQIKRHKPASWRHHLRNLLALKVNYRVEDIMVAIRRARQYKVFDSGTIERFLENNSEPRYTIKLSFNPKKNDGNEQ